MLKKLRKVFTLRTIWTVLAGFLPGVLVGGVIAILGLFLFSPEPNVPPPQRDNSPGDVTIQLSQSFLSAVASQKLEGTGIPVLGASLPLENVRAQPQSGDQLFVMGDVEVPITGLTRQVMINLTPCVASNGKPAAIVTGVFLGGKPITGLVGQTVQDKVNNGLNGTNLNVPNEHLARIQTTSSAMILIYTSGTSGQGQPAC